MRLLNVAAGCLLLALHTTATAATHQVSVISFRYEPAELTIQPGDTVVWRNTGGVHNVVADDNSFTNGDVSSAAWTYSRTFTTAGQIGYYCAPHGGPGGIGMAGRITVAGTTPSIPINPGINGTWFDPNRPGQGFVLDVVPTINSLIVGWFTWSATEAGRHDWISAIGPIAANGESATVDLQRSTGGLFNSATPPVVTTSIGSATFRFSDCGNGTLTFQRNDINQSGTISIRRVAPAPSSCVNPTAAAE
ncbi:MAG: cupredoxin domain-containing protein [Pseudomarimonas sp.]